MARWCNLCRRHCLRRALVTAAHAGGKGFVQRATRAGVSLMPHLLEDRRLVDQGLGRDNRWLNEQGPAESLYGLLGSVF